MEINSVSKRDPNTSSQSTDIAMAGFLTECEVKYTDHALEALRKVQWATSLISKVETNGGINKVMPSLRFEVRYAYALHRQNIEAQYEYQTGEGDSSVDFRCIGKHEWLIELVSILPSQAGKQATRDFNPGGIKLPNGIEAYEQTLATNAENPKMSEEGEIILAQQKIGEKVFSNGKPTKFPVPTNAFHVIVVDMRGMLGIGGGCDQDDYLEIAYGAKRANQLGCPCHQWKTSNGQQPIVGLFEKGNPLQSAKYIQERIHFIDFVCEEQYEENEIIERTSWEANPFLLAKDKVHNVRNSYPLYR